MDVVTSSSRWTLHWWSIAPLPPNMQCINGKSISNQRIARIFIKILKHSSNYDSRRHVCYDIRFIFEFSTLFWSIWLFRRVLIAAWRMEFCLFSSGMSTLNSGIFPHFVKSGRFLQEFLYPFFFLIFFFVSTLWMQSLIIHGKLTIEIYINYREYLNKQEKSKKKIKYIITVMFEWRNNVKEIYVEITEQNRKLNWIKL